MIAFLRELNSAFIAIGILLLWGCITVYQNHLYRTGRVPTAFWAGGSFQPGPDRGWYIFAFMFTPFVFLFMCLRTVLCVMAGHWLVLLPFAVGIWGGLFRIKKHRLETIAVPELDWYRLPDGICNDYLIITVIALFVSGIVEFIWRKFW